MGAWLEAFFSPKLYLNHANCQHFTIFVVALHNALWLSTSKQDNKIEKTIDFSKYGYWF